MLIPAIAYKDEIEKYSDILRYDQKMMYYNGCIEHGRINIQTDYDEGRYQWAIVDKDKNLVGYIAYDVDHYASSAYSFGLIAFTDDHRAMAAGILEVLHRLKAMKLHRIEWRCVADNPAQKHYLRIWSRVRSQYANTYRLLHVFKDERGHYHDLDIFELVGVRE